MPLQRTALFSVSALMPPSDHHHTKALLTAVLVHEAPGHWLFHGVTTGHWWQHVDLSVSCCEIPELKGTGNRYYAVVYCSLDVDGQHVITKSRNCCLIKCFFVWHRGGYETASRHFVAKDLSVDLDGRSFMITGANSGIGKATAMAIARKGQWSVPIAGPVPPLEIMGDIGRLFCAAQTTVCTGPCAD